MNEKLKKSLVLVGLFAAICGVMVVKHLKMQEVVEHVSAFELEPGVPAMLELGSVGCAACKMMMPIIEELKTEYKGSLSVGFIDVHQDETAVEKYEVEFIPTQIFFDKDGKELFRHVGYFSKDEILAKLSEFGIELAKE